MPRAPLLLLRRLEQPDEVLRGGRRGELAEGVRFGFEARRQAMLEAALDCFQGAERRRIVAVRAREQRAARLAVDELARDWQELRQIERSLQVEPELQPPVERSLWPASPRASRTLEHHRVDHLVQQARTKRPARVQAAPAQDQVQRASQPDQTRQPLRPTPRRYQAKIDLRLAEDDIRRVQRDAIVAGERQFQPAAQRCAVDRGDGGARQPGQFVEDRLKPATGRFDLTRVVSGGDELQIGPGDKLACLATRHDQPPQTVVRPRRADRRPQVLDQRGIDGIDGVIRPIDHDPADPVRALDRGLEPGGAERRRGSFGDGRHVRSSTMAAPTPPAAHTETSPNCAERRSISLTSVVTHRAPVAPNGWPSAIDPPRRLIRLGSMQPTALERPSSSSAKAFESSFCSVESTCAANASCISTTSMSASVSPARSSAIGIAYAGPMSSWPAGSTAAYAYDRTNAFGVMPSERARVADITSTLAAPSVSGLELPAVTVP